MSVSRRNFLRGFGLSLAAVAAPKALKATRADPEEFIGLFFENLLSSPLHGYGMRAIGTILEPATVYRLYVELPDRTAVRGLAASCAPGDIMLRQLAEPPALASPVDLSYFEAGPGQLLPVDIPIQNPMLIEVSSNRDHPVELLAVLGLVSAPPSDCA